MLMGSYKNIMYFLREFTILLPPDAVSSYFWKYIYYKKGAASLLSMRCERGYTASAELNKAI